MLHVRIYNKRILLLITVAIISVNLRSDSTVCKSVISRINHLLVITNKNSELRCTNHDFFFSALLVILSKHIWLNITIYELFPIQLTKGLQSPIVHKFMDLLKLLQFQVDAKFLPTSVLSYRFQFMSTSWDSSQLQLPSVLEERTSTFLDRSTVQILQVVIAWQSCIL